MKNIFVHKNIIFGHNITKLRADSASTKEWYKHNNNNDDDDEDDNSTTITSTNKLSLFLFQHNMILFYNGKIFSNGKRARSSIAERRR